MDPSEKVTSTKTFSTPEAVVIRHVLELPARFKFLVSEDSSFAGWIASALCPYVTKLIVCDPRQNSLISRGNNDDCRDATDLYRLLRLGELIQVFHSDHEHRMVFKIIVQQCLRFTRDHLF